MNTTPLSYRDHLGDSVLALVDAVLAAWPEHEKFLRTSFRDRSSQLLDTTDIIAQLLVTISTAQGRILADYAADYRYLCEKIVYPEELYFRREGKYRLSTFAEAVEQVYNDTTVMSRYMNGLFVSDALWFNHASAMNDFAKLYLPGTRAGGSHLEIGPGHGMLLHLALRFGRFERLSAWDVSATSVAHAGNVLEILGERDRVSLHLRDLYARETLADEKGRYDTIVFSEVLEHLEEPFAALSIIRELLAPGGTVWINVPANGPAPDHLFLLRSPDEARKIVEAAGLEVIRADAFPVAGSTIERAISQELPISCVLTAKKVG
jgi:2-polyprenyl-3-methyl-5-hydroxy-6-metoxy-1,4-benzoquinol methylase